MRCPNCHQSEFELAISCPTCEFTGALASLERLSHLNFLLSELEKWPTISHLSSQRADYEKQRREVEVKLGLRLPPPTVEQAEELQHERLCLNLLSKNFGEWDQKRWLPSYQSILAEEIQPRLQEIEQRLLDAPPPQPKSRLALFVSQIEQKRFLLTQVEGLYKREEMVKEGYELIVAELSQEIEALEIKVGLREIATPKAESKKAQPSQSVDSVDIASQQEELPGLPLPARSAWTWDRFWETLLSEQTLQAILFMGVALMFAAGISLVVYNWETFRPAVQVAFLASFTGLFYGLGWYVREKMKLEGSGIALTAVASLLVPLDFYAFYLSGGFPAERWEEIWIGTSGVCLVAYTLTTYSVQAPFFPYFVAAAASSLLTSTLSWLDIDIKLWTAPLALLALILAAIGEGLAVAALSAKEKAEKGENRTSSIERWYLFATPFWRSGLIMMVVLLLLGTSWSILQREQPAFFLALALSWWIGGFLFSLATKRFRLPLITLALLAFPIAMLFTQRWYFELQAIPKGWYGLGWATLIPFYWAAAWWLKGRFWQTEDHFYDTNRRLLLRASTLLVILAAFSSLLTTNAASVVHLFLALLMLGAAILWQKSRLIWLMSLFLMSASGAWQASRGAALAELTLPWALLSILHIIAALLLTEKHINDIKIEIKPELKEFISQPSRSALYGAALMLAGLALLPPLLLFDQSLLTGALGNWIGINGWLAYLAEDKDGKPIRTWLASWQRTPTSRLTLMPTLSGKGNHSAHILQWFAALSLLPWLWLNWTNGRPASATLAFGYSLLAWALFVIALRLRKHYWPYGKPWQVAAHLSQVIALVVGRNDYQQGWLATILLLGAAFYFTSAKQLYNHRWLYPGAIIFQFGGLTALNWFGIEGAPLYLAATLVVYAYILIPDTLIRYSWIKENFRQPLYQVALLNGVIIFFSFLDATANWWNDPMKLLWLSGGQIILALSAALWCWFSGKRIFGHIAAWLMIYGGGLLVKIYSSGSGRSAALIALLAVTYVLTERTLHWLALSKRKSRQPLFVLLERFGVSGYRKAWRLFRKPLLVTGWIISVAAIGAALVRNLLLLGGSITQQMWTIIALLIITALYALSARLFRQARFVWYSSFLAFISWTVSTYFVWRHILEWEDPIWYSVSWMALALFAVTICVFLAYLAEAFTEYNTPPLKLAHLLVPLALLWANDDYTISSITFGLGILFYLAIVWMERRFEGVKASQRGRFLYQATALMPVWAVYLLLTFVPLAAQTTIGLLVLAFALPMLLIGKRLAVWEKSYDFPLYVTAYGSAIMATLLVAYQPPFLIGVLLFNTGLTAFSAYWLRNPLWLYIASITLPWAMILSFKEAGIASNRYGWGLIILGGSYLLVARALKKRQLMAYAIPPMNSASGLITIGLAPSSLDRRGALVGYSLAGAISLISAIWLYQPLLANIAVGLAIVPYWMIVLELGITSDNYGLALWPGIILALALMRHLSKHYQLSYQWTYALYAVGFGSLIISPLLSLATGWQLPLSLTAGTLVWGWAIYYFQQRRWLFLTALWTQLTALALINWLELGKTVAEIAFYFTPITILTAVIALLIEYRFNEGLPLLWGEEVMLRFSLKGWSRPLYGLLVADMLLAQRITLFHTAGSVTIVHLLIIGTLTTLWRLSILTYISLGLGLVSLLQYFYWNYTQFTTWPVGIACLGLGYGVLAYSLYFWQSRQQRLPEQLMIWQAPLEYSSWLISFLSLSLTLFWGMNIISLIMPALLGQPISLGIEILRTQMVILVFAIVGLLYLTAALVKQQRKIGYAALLLLLSSWSIWLLLIQQQSELQYYALPAGSYLLGLGWLEWHYGSRLTATRIDYAALLLLLGSGFWQSMTTNQGGWYALLMGIESLLIVWWGSSRRMRRFLYAGVAGVMLSITGQLIDPLFQLDTLVLLLLGGSLLTLAIALERRLEEVRRLSRDLRLRLEQWD